VIRLPRFSTKWNTFNRHLDLTWDSTGGPIARPVDQKVKDAIATQKRWWTSNPE